MSSAPVKSFVRGLSIALLAVVFSGDNDSVSGKIVRLLKRSTALVLQRCVARIVVRMLLWGCGVEMPGLNTALAGTGECTLHFVLRARARREDIPVCRGHVGGIIVARRWPRGRGSGGGISK